MAAFFRQAVVGALFLWPIVAPASVAVPQGGHLHGGQPMPPEPFEEVVTGWDLMGGMPASIDNLCWMDLDGDGRPDLRLELADGAFFSAFSSSGPAFLGSRAAPSPGAGSCADRAPGDRPGALGRVFLRFGPGCELEVDAWRPGTALPCGTPLDVDAADFDNDGGLDVLVAWRDGPDGEPGRSGILLFPAGDAAVRVPLDNLVDADIDPLTNIFSPAAISLADFDLDGGVDAAILSAHGVWILRGAGMGGNFVEFQPGDAAWIEVQAGDLMQRWAAPPSTVPNGASPMVHFGLGPAASIDRVKVGWRDGNSSSFGPAIRANAAYEFSTGGLLALLTGPLLEDVAATAHVTVGEPARFSMRLEEDSPPANLLWEFGDGAWAEGADANHAYAQPGLHHARAHAFAGEDGHAAALHLVMVHGRPPDPAGTPAAAAPGGAASGSDGGVLAAAALVVAAALALARRALR